MWRIFLYYCINDTRLLSVPVHIPLLFRLLPSEIDPTDFHHSKRCIRQSSLATYILYGDACLSHDNGLGVYIPDIGWGSYQLPTFTHYYDQHGDLSVIDINVLEFLASILSLVCLLTYLHSMNISTAHLHVHIFTDNTSCKSWMTKHKSTHPLHAFLLQIYSLLQFHYGLILTTGYLQGALNIFADGASRQFQVPEGLRIRAFLNQLVQFQTCLPLLEAVKRVSTSPLKHTSALTLDAVTTLELIISDISVNTTVFPSHSSRTPY